MDFFADNMVKRIIGEIVTEKDTLKNDTAIWKCLTRQMFHNYSSIQVLDWVYECLEESSDEQWLEKKWMNDKSFKKRDHDYKPERKTVIKVNLKKQAIKKAINENLKISEVAEKYGLNVKNNMCVCPFHDDNKASLSLSDEKNVFNCFGCRAKGDIIEFIKRMENGQKRS